MRIGREARELDVFFGSAGEAFTLRADFDVVEVGPDAVAAKQVAGYGRVDAARYEQAVARRESGHGEG